VIAKAVPLRLAILSLIVNALLIAFFLWLARAMRQPR